MLNPKVPRPIPLHLNSRNWSSLGFFPVLWSLHTAPANHSRQIPSTSVRQKKLPVWKLFQVQFFLLRQRDCAPFFFLFVLGLAGVWSPPCWVRWFQDSWIGHQGSQAPALRLSEAALSLSRPCVLRAERWSRLDLGGS